MLSFMRPSLDDATRRDCSASLYFCWERHIHQTRHEHIQTASSCIVCIAHISDYKLLDAAKQHDVEDDHP